MDSLRRAGRRAVPALIQALKDPSVRLFAVTTLAEIGRPAVESLEQLAGTGDPVLAEAAQTALNRMRPAVR